MSFYWLRRRLHLMAQTQISKWMLPGQGCLHYIIGDKECKMDNTFPYTKFFSGLFLLLATSSIVAQEQTLVQLDTDEDGKISIKEAVADPVLLASFGKIDTDGDGKISKEELASADLIKEIKD